MISTMMENKRSTITHPKSKMMDQKKENIPVYEQPGAIAGIQTAALLVTL